MTLKIILPLLLVFFISTSNAFAFLPLDPTSIIIQSSTTQLPLVVNNTGLINQVSSIGQSTIYTPKTDGVYLITLYQTITSVGTAGTLSNNIYWTDDWSAKSTVGASSLSLTSSNSFSNGINYIQAKGGTPIQFSTSLNGALGSPQYSIYLTVEKLS